MYRFFHIKYQAVFSLFALMLSNSVIAQFYESGTEPASVRWQQIQTEHFRIIFPKDGALDGQRAANVLEYIYQAEGKTLNHHPAKIPVVLHNRIAFSNGFVSWAPKRSEWFLTPPQDNYAQDWLNQLAIHEYRHVVQTDKLNQGLTKVMGFAVGQQAVGAVAGMLPPWFLEGDAVATETALTNAGRGRSPAFEMPLRAIALSGKYQNYDQALFGSYKDHVPNHYQLGYQMVGWTRERYGTKPFEMSINMVARKPYLFPFYLFKLGIKKETGYYTGQLYQNAFADLTLRWNEQELKTGYENVAPINRHSNHLYTNYRSPQYIDDTTFVALKTGIAQIAQFVKVDKNGRELIIHTPGFVNSDRFSYSNDLLAWTEQVSDVRWSNRSYSVVKLFNLKTGIELAFQQRTRYFAPALSPDGAALAAVNVPVEGTSEIVILDLVTGKETEHLPNPDGAFLQTPAWCRDGKSLLVIINNKNGKSIAKIDVATGQYTTVLPPSYQDISYPVDGGAYAYFNGYYNGITNIYAVDYRTGDVFQVSSARFGAFDPQPGDDGKHLIYADYSAKGYNLVEINMSDRKWTPVDQLTDYSLKLYETLARQEGFNLQDSIVPEKEHTIKPYRKWTNLLNVHSWAPLYYEVDVADVTSTELYPGVVLFSQDLLGNLTGSAGYSWRGYNAFHAGVTYKGLYPVFDFKMNYGGKNLFIRPSDISQNLPEHNRLHIDLRAYIPFSFTRSRWVTGFTPQIRFSYHNDYLYSTTTNDFQYGMCEMSYSVQAYRYLKMSVRDLSPRLGIVLQGACKHTPWNEQLGYICYMYGRVYLPGVAQHHSLRLSASWQKQETKQYLFGTWLSFPRGYYNYRTEKLNIATADYSLPICYPDWNLSFLWYLKRITTNLFCDIAQNHYRTMDGATKQLIWQTGNMCSLGIDMLADVHLLQIQFPINMGIRTVYIPESRDVQPSLLLSVTF